MGIWIISNLIMMMMEMMMIALIIVYCLQFETWYRTLNKLLADDSLSGQAVLTFQFIHLTFVFIVLTIFIDTSWSHNHCNHTFSSATLSSALLLVSLSFLAPKELISWWWPMLMLKSSGPSGSGARLLGSGPLSLLDFVLHAPRALRPCDPRNGAMIGSCVSHWLVC